MREYRTSRILQEYILNAIAGNPGRTVPALAILLNIDESTARRHVYRLVKVGKVSEEYLRGRNRLYVRTKEIPTLAHQKMHALSEEGLKRVYEAVYAEGTSAGRVSGRVDMAYKRTVRHLNELARRGYVEKRGRYLWSRTNVLPLGFPSELPDAGAS